MDDLGERLKNWKRWLSLRDWMPARYRTILGVLYRSPQCWEMPEPRVEIDHLDAVLIEKAIHQLPDKYMIIFILQHLGQVANGERVIRKIDRMEKYRISGIPERRFYREVKRSEIMVQNILLTSVKSRGKNRGNPDRLESYALEEQAP